jgi:hypothetical protein
MRGRNNNGGGGNNNNNMNNRKGPNPLTRNYESNGPDVKIRGSAQQIAEKYAQLARDAHSSGDRVMAENYLQHAEHYNRIIAAAQAQLPVQNTQNNRDNSDDNDDDRDETDNQSGNPQGNIDQGNAGQSNRSQHGGDRNGGDRNGGNQNNGDADQPQPMQVGSGPQPDIQGMPAEVALNSDSSENGNAVRNRPSNGGNDDGVPEADAQAPRRRERKPRRSRSPISEEAGSDSGLAQTLSRGIALEPAADPEDKSDSPLIDADG